MTSAGAPLAAGSSHRSASTIIVVEEEDDDDETSAAAVAADDETSAAAVAADEEDVETSRLRSESERLQRLLSSLQGTHETLEHQLLELAQMNALMAGLSVNSPTALPPHAGEASPMCCKRQASRDAPSRFEESSSRRSEDELPEGGIVYRSLDGVDDDDEALFGPVVSEADGAAGAGTPLSGAADVRTRSARVASIVDSLEKTLLPGGREVDAAALADATNRLRTLLGAPPERSNSAEVA